MTNEDDHVVALEKTESIEQMTTIKEVVKRDVEIGNGKAIVIAKEPSSKETYRGGCSRDSEICGESRIERLHLVLNKIHGPLSSLSVLLI